MPPSQTCSGTPSRLCTSASRATPAGRIRARARSTPKRRAMARAGRVSTRRSASASSASPSQGPTSRRAARALPPTASAASTRGGTTAAKARAASRPGLRETVDARGEPHRAEIDRARPRSEPCAASRPRSRSRRRRRRRRRSSPASGDVRRGDGAAVGEPSLLVGREHAHGMPGCARQRGDELLGVAALPPGRREEDVERLDGVPPREPAQLGDRPLRGAGCSSRRPRPSARSPRRATGARGPSSPEAPRRPPGGRRAGGSCSSRHRRPRCASPPMVGPRSEGRRSALVNER